MSVFAGDITYIKEVDEGIDNIRIPSMILQPLVENAVQHGIHDCMETGWIRMEIHRNGEMLDVTVSDEWCGNDRRNDSQGYGRTRRSE